MAWQSIKIGDFGPYENILEVASSLAEANAQLAEAIKIGYQITTFLSDTSTDYTRILLEQFFKPLEAILDDLENIGFYYLEVTPFSGINSRTARPATIGSYYAAGKILVPAYKLNNELYPVGKGPNPNATQSTDSDGLLLQVEVPFFEPSEDPGSVSNMQTGLLEMTPSQVINTMIAAMNDENDPNRPVGSSEGQVGGVVLIGGTSDFRAFVELIAGIVNFFNITSFKNFSKELNDIFFGNASINLKMKDVCQLNKDGTNPPNISQGSFGENDILIGSTSGFTAQVKKSKSTKVQTVKRRSRTNILAATIADSLSIQRDDESAYVDVNTHGLQEQEVEVVPLSKLGGFVPGEIICLAQPYKVEILNKEGSAIDDPSGLEAEGKTLYREILSGMVTVGRVLDTTEELGQSIKPDFVSLRLKDIIPQYGDALNLVRSYLDSLKGALKTAKDGTDALIDYLNRKIQQAEELSNALNSLIQLFQIGIPAGGLYAIYLPPQGGGLDNFAQRLQSAENRPPDDLKFSSGIILMNGGPDVKYIETFASLLGL